MLEACLGIRLSYVDVMILLSLKTYVIYSDGAICFIGDCIKKCGVNHPICGHPELIAASFALLIPQRYKHKSYWNYISVLTIPSHLYCRTLASYIDEGVAHAEAFLDMIDINIFDYIQGEYEQFYD